MRLQCKVFHVPKDGNSSGEYEDAFLGSTHGIASLPHCCVVADGATESAFSRLWARLLVRAFYENAMQAFSETPSTNNDDWKLVLNDCRRKWFDQVNILELPWYAEEKVRKGAYATILGICFRPIGKYGQWKAVAVGDCNLFHIRNNECIRSFPIQHSSEFCSCPNLISSRSLLNEYLPIQYNRGRFKCGDSFYLMTDAIAQWFLKCCEAPDQQATVIREVDSIEHSNFTSWISTLRDSKQMLNDDVTLMRVNFWSEILL